MVPLHLIWNFSVESYTIIRQRREEEISMRTLLALVACNLLFAAVAQAQNTSTPQQTTNTNNSRSTSRSQFPQSPQSTQDYRNGQSTSTVTNPATGARPRTINGTGSVTAK